MADNRFAEACKFDRSYWGIVERIQPSLRPVAGAFVVNMERVRSIGTTPINMIALTAAFQKSVTEATHRKTGAYALTQDCPPEALADIWKIANHIFVTNVTNAQENPDQKTPVSLDDLLSATGESHLQNIVSGIEPLANGLQSIMTGMIVGAWTAFETLAGDLWDTAIGLHPDVLIEKVGKTDERKNAKFVVLTVESETLKRSNGNLFNCLIDLLKKNERANMSFLSYDDLRRAYKDGFNRNFDSLNTKKNNSLFQLAKTRNVIVHNNLITDDQFVSEMVKVNSPLPQFVDLEKGQQIPIDGALVFELINGTVKSSVRLIQDINDWLLGRKLRVQKGEP